MIQQVRDRNEREDVFDVAAHVLALRVERRGVRGGGEASSSARLPKDAALHDGPRPDELLNRELLAKPQRRALGVQEVPLGNVRRPDALKVLARGRGLKVLRGGGVPARGEVRDVARKHRDVRAPERVQLRPLLEEEHGEGTEAPILAVPPARRLDKRAARRSTDERCGNHQLGWNERDVLAFRHALRDGDADAL